MAFFGGLTQLFSKSRGSDSATSATKLKKLKAGAAQSREVWFTKSAQKEGKPLKAPDRGLINSDITQYRYGKDTNAIVRDFASATPDLSASTDAYLRTGITSKYTAVAKNPDGTFNKDATVALQNLISKFDVLKDYEEGFSNIKSIRSLSESLGKELRYYGACALELVLDKARVPLRLQPVSVTTVTFAIDKEGLKPSQKVDGEERSLDYPTFLYVSLDQDLLTPYPSSPLESALQPVLFMQEFMNDLRKIVRQAIHPRIKVKLETEEIMRWMPPEYKDSSEKKQEYINHVINAVADEINGLEPEDALVYLDTMNIEYLTAGNISHDTEMTALKNIVNGKIATGVKTLPSILGQGTSSNNIASSETLLFMKSAEGAIQLKLNEILSQALTLSLRLLGYDVVATFEYDKIDLRPDSELEAFKSMKQSRVLELLSCGLLTDDEAHIELCGRLPHADYENLSGTFFRGRANEGGTGNPYSNTSQSTLGQNITPRTPRNNKGTNGGKRGN